MLTILWESGVSWESGVEWAHYLTFDHTAPDPDNVIEDDIKAIRDNFNALLDGILMGIIPGFDYSWSGGYAYQPTYQFFKNGTTWIRLTYTWNADGNPTTIVCELSTDSGANYDIIRTDTYTWNASGDPDTITRV